jgi:hypothetical protein
MMRRYWINQPSTHQTAHALHGRRVLGPEKLTDEIVEVYFIDGPVISARLPRTALSPTERWPAERTALQADLS